MKPEDLSKVKYIYRIYESYPDGKLHCEKYPVIYINKEVTYFKTGKTQFLKHISTNLVLDNFTSFSHMVFKQNWQYRTYFDRYFWNVETDVGDILEDLKKQLYSLKNTQREAYLRHEVNIKRNAYDSAMRELSKYLKEKENAGKD